MRSLVQSFYILALATSASAADYQWKLTDVDAVGTGSRSAEVKVTADGRAHLAYAGCGKSNCNPETALWYAVRESNGLWTKTMVDHSAEDVGRHAGLEILSDGSVHILYGDKTHQYLRWAQLPAGSKTWKTARVAPKWGGSWVGTTRFEDTIYVTHTRFNQTQMRENFLELGILKAGKWVFQVLEPGGWVTAVTTHPKTGDLVISSHDGAYFRGDVHLNYQENGVWNRQAIDGNATKLNSAVDSRGFIHSVYAKADAHSDQPADDVFYATNAPDGRWKVELLDGEDTARADVFFPSIAIDANDTLHVSYRDYERNQLSYARKPAGGKWEFSSIEHMGRPLYSKLHVGADGKLHIAIENAGRMYYGSCQNCVQ